jgi:DNA-binding NtrC family response regulator
LKTSPDRIRRSVVRTNASIVLPFASIFKILCRAKMNDETAWKSKRLGELVSGSGELILLVDDEPSILRVTAMILDTKNYRVLCATDGPEALAVFALQMESVKAVLTDIMLPFMDGVALIRTIKKLKPDMAFIASTGDGDEARHPELRELGVRNFLVKPYDMETLLKTLRDALDRKASDPSEFA